MRIIRLRIENINSLEGVHEIDFTAPEYAEGGIFAITGPTGSGKTTILDAVTLALYGTTPRAEASGFHRAESEALVVTKNRVRGGAAVVFEAKGRFWRSGWSVRAKTRKGSSGGFNNSEVELVELDGADDATGRIVTTRKSDWCQRVEALVGMDFETFTRSVLLAQGAFAVLLRATKDDRTKILEGITGTAVYTAIGCEIHGRAISAANARDAVAAELDGLRPMTPQEREAVAAELAAERRTVDGRRSDREALEKALGWGRGRRTALRNLGEASGAAERLEAERPARDADRRRAAAARRAVLPLEAERRRQDCLAEEKRHEGERIRLADQGAAARRRSDEAAAALDEAQAALREAQAQRNAREPVLRAIEAEDAAIERKTLLLDAAERNLAEARARENEAGRKAERARRQSDEAESCLSRMRELLDRTQGDEELPARMAAIRLRADDLGRLEERVAVAERTLAGAEADVVRCAAQEAASGAGVREREAAAKTAAERVNEAAAALGIALAGSSFEQKMAGMRELTGRAWAAEWLLETQALLRALGPVASGGTGTAADEVLRNVRAMLEARALRLRSRFSGLEHVTSEADVARLHEAVEATVEWSRGAGRAREALEAARRERQAAEAAAGQAGRDQAAATGRTAAARKLAEARREALADARKALAGARERFEAELRPFRRAEQGVVGEPDPVAEVKALADRAGARSRAEEAAAAAGTEAVRLRAARDAAEEERSQYAEGTAQALQAAETARRERDDTRKARRERFGDRDASGERRALEAAVAAALERQGRAADAAGAAAGDVRQLEALAARAAEEAESARRKAAATAAELARRLAAAGFPDLAAAQAAHLAPGELEALEEAVHGFERASAGATARLEAARRALEALESDPAAPAGELREATEEELVRRAAEAARALDEAEEKAAALRSRLEADDALRRRHADTLRRLEEAGAVRDRWARLDALVGGPDGRIFRHAAQRLTFGILLEQANAVLREMQSRYELASAGGDSLGICVRDLDLAGIERPAENLSGGECFLVSLALAIALSRVNSRRIQVDTLFLDEGFGSLDPVSLEKALSALESLQQRSGKLIGLISHVAAVRERVGVQITVRPRGSSGRSLLEGPGVRRL